MLLYPWEEFAVSFPVLAMVLVAIALACHRIKELLVRRKQSRPRRRIGVFTSRAVLGIAFLPLPVMYRPSMVEAAKTQIQQQEDVDEDESGDRESPLKQLGKIRRGEEIEAITLRLE